METHTTETKQEWLKLRHKNINSTESCALFGLSPYTTEFEIYHAKRDAPVEIQDNFRMKAGRLLEDGIAALALDEIQCKGRPFKEYVVLPEARMGSSFDYLITEGDYEDWLLECKNVDFIQYQQKWTEWEAPAHIECQVQHQMHVADKPGCIIAALVGGNELKLIFRERDYRFGDKLEAAVRKFWHNFNENIEPEPDFERDANIIKELYGNATKGKVVDFSGNTEISSLLADYREIQAHITELNERKDAIKAQLFIEAGDAAKLTCDGYTVSMGRTSDVEGRLVTEDMVGTRIGGRKGYRQFRVTVKK